VGWSGSHRHADRVGERPAERAVACSRSRVDRAFSASLLPLGRVWVGAGSDRHMAGIAPAELVRLARATPRDIAADD
jgi:hypothetical protein